MSLPGLGIDRIVACAVHEDMNREREVRRCAWRVLGVAMGERAGQRMHATSNTHMESADFSTLYHFQVGLLDDQPDMNGRYKWACYMG
jgi:hypothetical protein